MKLEQDRILADVKKALAEDLGDGDVTADLLPADRAITAEIIAREPLLLCGIPWVEAVFKTLNASIHLDWQADEGQWIDRAGVLCKIHGNARAILSGERCALNFLQTLSATATQTYHYVQALAGSKTRILDTRKTLPGLRMAQKYAVACAGGKNHRFGLYDAYLIKENHIKACGSIAKAIAQARKLRPDLFLEIEVETLDELRQALEAKPDRILLDNFTCEDLRKAVTMNQSHACSLEASGGMDLSSLKAVAATGVDYISVGAITKSVKAIDLSLLIREVQ